MTLMSIYKMNKQLYKQWITTQLRKLHNMFCKNKFYSNKTVCSYIANLFRAFHKILSNYIHVMSAHWLHMKYLYSWTLCSGQPRVHNCKIGKAFRAQYSKHRWFNTLNVLSWRFAFEIESYWLGIPICLCV